MVLFHKDNEVFSHITEKIIDKSRITGNWVSQITEKIKAKSQITEKITAPITDHRNTPFPLLRHSWEKPNQTFVEYARDKDTLYCL